MKVYRQWVPCKRNSLYNFILIFMQLCTSFFHGLKMCMWFGFNPGVNFCHFSTLLILSFFKFSQVRHQLHRSLIYILTQVLSRINAEFWPILVLDSLLLINQSINSLVNRIALMYCWKNKGEIKIETVPHPSTFPACCKTLL